MGNEKVWQSMCMNSSTIYYHLLLSDISTIW